MAYLLFIDTAAAEALIGLAENGKWIQVKVLPDARSLGAALHDEAAALLESAGKTWAQIDAIAVVSGPGSYTGLRVGTAAAKGWCFALDIPLIMLNRLALLQMQAHKKGSCGGNTALLLPARAGEWFAIGADAHGKVLFSPTHLTQAAFAAAHERWNFEKIILVGAAGQQPVDWPESKIIFVENKLSTSGLDAFLQSSFTQKVFADWVTAKPEYLKGVYINS